MNKEQRQLLLKDLCARLPYEPKARKGGMETNINLTTLDSFYYGDEIILPYLRPMSSMTDKEYAEFLDTQHWECGDGNQPKYEYTYKTFDWLNEHHFDYRGLIGMGLALEAPEGMYEIKG